MSSCTTTGLHVPPEVHGTERLGFGLGDSGDHDAGNDIVMGEGGGDWSRVIKE